jgi:hypothetical protein
VLLMVRRRVADLWRRATKDANQVLIHWADLYRELLASIGALANDTTVSDTDVRERLRLLVAEHQQRKPPTRAQLVRDHLTIEIQPVRSLLSALMALPWEATPGHPVLAAMQTLKALYEHGARELPTTISIEFGKVWRGCYPVPIGNRRSVPSRLPPKMAQSRYIVDNDAFRQFQHMSNELRLIFAGFPRCQLRTLFDDIVDII